LEEHPVNNKIVAIAIIAIIAVSAGAIFLLATYDAKKPTAMSVVLYNAQGEEVYRQDSSSDPELVAGALQNVQGQVVTTAVVTISYQVLGLASTYDSIEVTLNGAAKGYVGYTTPILQYSISESEVSYDKSGQWQFTYTLTDLIDESGSTGQTYGWGIVFEYTLTAIETFSDGSTKMAQKPLSDTISLTYTTGAGGAGEITIDGNINWTDEGVIPSN